MVPGVYDGAVLNAKLNMGHIDHLGVMMLRYPFMLVLACLDITLSVLGRKCQWQECCISPLSHYAYLATRLCCVVLLASAGNGFLHSVADVG